MEWRLIVYAQGRSQRAYSCLIPTLADRRKGDLNRWEPVRENARALACFLKSGEAQEVMSSIVAERRARALAMDGEPHAQRTRSGPGGSD